MWPLDAEVKLEGEGKMGQVPKAILLGKRVFPGENVQVKVEFKAPEIPGKYVWWYFLSLSGD